MDGEATAFPSPCIRSTHSHHEPSSTQSPPPFTLDASSGTYSSRSPPQLVSRSPQLLCRTPSQISNGSSPPLLLSKSPPSQKPGKPPLESHATKSPPQLLTSLILSALFLGILTLLFTFGAAGWFSPLLSSLRSHSQPQPQLQSQSQSQSQPQPQPQLQPQLQSQSQSQPQPAHENVKPAAGIPRTLAIGQGHGGKKPDRGHESRPPMLRTNEASIRQEQERTKQQGRWTAKRQGQEAGPGNRQARSVTMGIGVGLTEQRRQGGEVEETRKGNGRGLNANAGSKGSRTGKGMGPRPKGSARSNSTSSSPRTRLVAMVTRERALVAGPVRARFEQEGLRPLSPAQSESLGAPCSALWKAKVFQYLGGGEKPRKERALVKRHMRKVCSHIRLLDDPPQTPLGSHNTHTKSSTAEQHSSSSSSSGGGGGRRNLGAVSGTSTSSTSIVGSNSRRSSTTEIPRRSSTTSDSLKTAPSSSFSFTAIDKNSTLRSGILHASDSVTQQPCWPGTGLPLSSGIQVSQLLRRKFLVAAMSMEQLSKAKMHLAEAARLARRSGRILVVPPASRSRLTLGRSLPACSYLGFQNLALPRLKVRGVESEGGVEWMSADVFLMLLARFLPRKPSVAFLCLQTKGLWPCLEHYEVLSIMESILAVSYGAVPTPNNTAHVNLWYNPALNPSEVMSVLHNQMAQADIVVLLKMTPCMLHFRNPPIEHYSDALLPFAPSLRSRAQRAIRRLGRPYVALHFRSEFILWQMDKLKRREGAARRMQMCVTSAVRLATRVARELKAHYVFVAADVSLDGPFRLPASAPSHPPHTAVHSRSLQSSQSSLPLAESQPSLLPLHPGPSSASFADSGASSRARSDSPLPLSEPALQQPHAALPRLESALPWTGTSLPGPEPALPQVESALQQVEKSAFSRTEPALPRSEPALPGTGPALPRTEPALARTETALPRSDSWWWMVQKYGARHSTGLAQESLRDLLRGIPNAVTLEDLDAHLHELDPGEVSILDKLVAAHSDAFLAGVEECGGMKSFELDILRHRTNLKRTKPHVLRWDANP